MVAANNLLDILNTEPELDVFITLREEAAQVFTAEADWSDPAALQKLVLINSTIRESLRTNHLTGRGLMREVLPEHGLILPDGKRVQLGTWIGAPVHALHMDDKFYDRPDQYDPFQFARTASEKDRLDATHTSDIFLSWRYGRSAWSVPYILPAVQLSNSLLTAL